MILLAVLVGLTIGAPLLIWRARRRWLVVTVTGRSMAPTLHHGQRLVVRRVRRHRSDRGFARGDVVVFQLSRELPELADVEDDPNFRIKRITAVTADRVPEALRSKPWARGSTHVPPGKLIVAGDNPDSQGSRELGYVDEDDVIAVIRRDDAPHKRMVYR